MSTELRIKKLRSNIWIINYPKKQLVEVITLFLTFFRLLKANHFLIIFELSCFSLYPCFLQFSPLKVDYWYIDGQSLGIKKIAVIRCLG